jgi:D-aminopeptidase
MIEIWIRRFIRIVILARLHCSDFVLRSQALGGQHVTVATASGDARESVKIRRSVSVVAVQKLSYLTSPLTYARARRREIVAARHREEADRRRPPCYCLSRLWMISACC